MDERTRRFKRREDEEQELRLDDVLEPYEQEEPEETGFSPYDEAQPPYEQTQPATTGISRPMTRRTRLMTSASRTTATLMTRNIPIIMKPWTRP